MREALRDAVRHQFSFRCGYCGVSENDTGSTLTIDHFQPLSLEGTDDFENLVYACYVCNGFKHDWWMPDVEERILHPLTDNLAAHLRVLSNGTMIGLTATGRFHIEKLHLNRPALIFHRVEKQAIESERAQIAHLAQEMETILAQFREMGLHFPEP